MEKITWTEKIKKGMELIKQGCSENQEWGTCEKCPFTNYCGVIFDEYNMFPDYFFEDDVEE